MRGRIMSPFAMAVYGMMPRSKKTRNKKGGKRDLISPPISTPKEPHQIFA
jgi:hypothetical protein